MATITISGNAPTTSGYAVNLTFNAKFEKLNQKGNLVYEYNPFRNLRYVGNTEHLNGELVDFSTNLLKFSLNNPVNIECQPSYDGSVNLILNDDYSQPKIINSRFVCLENNTYKIVERYKNNNTNIYRNDPVKFDIDTSLYKKINKIPILNFIGLDSGGVNKVGNYTFYFKLADSDGNETDFIAESGIVSCFIGSINDPTSIRGGIKDENSGKLIKFKLHNIDSAYDYIKIYYVRTTSDVDGIRVEEAFKIDRDFLVQENFANIVITGYDTVTKVSLNEINAQYFNVTSAKAQTQCQNRLFLANINKPEIPYKELRDLALHFVPTVSQSVSVGWVTQGYEDYSLNGYEYYNPKNIYNNLGYWENELYRYGLVFIMEDFSLSPVFNTRGLSMATNTSNYTKLPLYDSSGNRQYIKYDEYSYLLNDSTKNLENVKGVVRFKANKSVICGEESKVYPIGVRFEPLVGENESTNSLLTEIKKYAKGFFFVRQKRIPTILAQAITINQDQCSYLPCISSESSYLKRPFIESFINKSRILDHDFEDHINSLSSTKARAAICPELSLRLPFYNQLFTGAKFTIEEARHQPSTLWKRDASNVRNYYLDTYKSNNINKLFTDVKLLSVEDNTKLTTSGSQKYSARAGDAEEAWRVSYIDREVSNTNATNIVRGSFGTYLGIEDYDIENSIINIRIPNYDESQMSNYYNIRYQDESPYQAISERYSLIEDDLVPNYTCYRGDCFVGNFTHRINRNFQDPEAPINDKIVNENTWKDNYSIDSKEKNAEINRGDVNAVKLGHWVTFKVCANINISLRDVDGSYFNEEGLSGRPRAFYPLYGLNVDGESKIPESSVINDGFNETLGKKYNIIMPNVPYLKNEFDNRILYSDIFVNDAFKNGYRVFKSTNFRDYTREYGSITDIISFNGNVICIFEHGVSLIPINERVLAGEGSGGEVFINTANILPLNPKMLSTNFGTTWQESLVTTPYFIYGVDSVGKKIWRTNGENFEIISDFKIQKFLNDNITLQERELTPTIGIRNIKSHYNAFKQDVMFTFYDDLYGFEENVWNMCFSEVLGKWVTQYSWIPSYSANIDNLYFSFDRTTSKWISKLGNSLKSNSYSDGVVISNVILPDSIGVVGTLDLVNRNIPDSNNFNVSKTFILEKDPFNNYLHFNIENGDRLVLTKVINSTIPIQLNIKCLITATVKTDDSSLNQHLNSWKDYVEVNSGYFENSLILSTQSVLNNLTTDFWKHGNSGILDISETLKPCYWYGKQHPFEFEFIVNDKLGIQKIFESLKIISNKAAPESFHYEIVGESYNFNHDKKNAYYRQEATKELYQNLGSNILFNRNYKELIPNKNNLSTLFPLYYQRIDTYDNVYDNYQNKQSVFSKDYQNLAGTEVVYNKLLSEYSLLIHSKANDIRQVGRLKGNMIYNEDIWNVEIRPINYVQKNESNWVVPPIILNNIPNDLTTDIITGSDLPYNYDITDITLPNYDWTERKETKVRDKYIRIKVRYTGNEKVIISALKTIYSISYV